MNNTGETPDRSDEARIARLLETAGRRPAPDPMRKARVRRVVHEAWRARIAARRRRRVLAGVAIAATATLAALAVFMTATRSPVVASSLGTVELVLGPAAAERGEESLTLAPNLPLRRGDVVRTGPGGRAALSIEAGFRLRADQETLFELVSRRTLFLRRGRIYIDTSAMAAQVEVRTPYGVVTDIGTQFELLSGDDGLRVRVRDGSVALQREGERATARRGEELLVPASGPLRRSSIDPVSPEWAWMLPLAPPFEIDGKTLVDLVDWASRETGYRVAFSSPQCHRRAEQTVLHGSLPSLPPMEAIRTILEATDFRLEVRGDLLRIDIREPEK